MNCRKGTAPPACCRWRANQGGQAAAFVVIGENAVHCSRSMATHRFRRLWTVLLILMIGVGAASPALAYDNPELLPDHPTPVIDLARAFSESQRDGLEQSLDQFEENTGWKLRVLTQYERTPGLALRDFQRPSSVNV